MNISIITFTENGTKLAEKIRQAFVSAKTEEAKNLGLSLSDWTRQQFAEKNAIVVIGACGIAVRMIAPFVSDKLREVQLSSQSRLQGRSAGFRSSQRQPM